VELVLGNIGDAPLEVRSITPSAGLRRPQVAKDSVPAQGELVVPLVVMPRLTGVIDESVGFETNDPERPLVVIPIRGYAQADPSSSAGLLILPEERDGGGYRLTVRNGTAFTVAVSLAGAHAPLLTVAPGARSEVTLSDQEQAEPELQVRFRSAPAGRPRAPGTATP
jgi:hypothetical protein